jgi:hypothetical protein
MAGKGMVSQEHHLLRLDETASNSKFKIFPPLQNLLMLQSADTADFNQARNNRKSRYFIMRENKSLFIRPSQKNSPSRGVWNIHP